jgi:HEAT repeat protein
MPPLSDEELRESSTRTTIMDPVRFDCISTAVDALLPRSENGDTPYGFVLMIQDVSEPRAAAAAMISNMDNIRAYWLLKPVCEKLQDVIAEAEALVKAEEAAQSCEVTATPPPGEESTEKTLDT